MRQMENLEILKFYFYTQHIQSNVQKATNKNIPDAK